MERKAIFFALVLTCLPGPLRAQDLSWQEACRQIVVVVAEKWSSTEGTMGRFERVGESWQLVDGGVPVTLGHRGLAVGLGLHPANLSGPKKEEGDKCAPAGVFSLEFGFGAKPLALATFPYRLAGEADLWIDDPKSRHYNQWVRSGEGANPRDWNSAEVLRRKDGIYDFVVVVGHNRRPVVQGRGSAIFLHAWYGPGRSTLGCTAMEKRRVRELLGWLDASKNPVLVQGPRTLLPHLGVPQGVLESMLR